MGSLVLTGDTSGSGTITVPSVAGTFTATIGSATGTHYPFTAGTAVASTSGTSIDFTSIPSWVKRITVMFNVVSTNGTSNYQVQLGSGSVETTGYTSRSNMPGLSATSTTGFLFTTQLSAASDTNSGAMTLCLLGSNIWTCVANSVNVGNSVGVYASGVKTLAGTLDRVRITTVNGTDTFDAGSINILYE